ncbi:MAG TPA: ester cyclase [Actinomycetes bacterium]|nr:ester cyclase [Actinomycetes bacterium]
MGLEENKAVVQRLFDTINSGSLDELPQIVAPDVVDHNAVIFMQPEGAGSVEEGVRMLLQGFPDLRLTTQELLAEGDQVVARFTMSGTNTGDYGDFRHPPSSTSRAKRLPSSASLTAGWPNSGAPPTVSGCSPSSASCPTSANPAGSGL